MNTDSVDTVNISGHNAAGEHYRASRGGERGALVFSGLNSSSGWQEKSSSVLFYIRD